MEEEHAVLMVKLMKVSAQVCGSARAENLPRSFQIERISNSVTDDTGIDSSRSIIVTEVRISDGHLLYSMLHQTRKFYLNRGETYGNRM